MNVGISQVSNLLKSSKMFLRKGGAHDGSGLPVATPDTISSICMSTCRARREMSSEALSSYMKTACPRRCSTDCVFDEQHSKDHQVIRICKNNHFGVLRGGERFHPTCRTSLMQNDLASPKMLFLRMSLFLAATTTLFIAKQNRQDGQDREDPGFCTCPW